MLNRRTLRIKAMQNLYAFNQNKSSDYYQALDLIKDTFEPEWKSVESELEGLKADRDKALSVFKECFEKDELLTNEPLSERVKEVIGQAFDYYHNLVRKDYEYFRSSMINDAERTFDLHLWILELLVQFSEFVNIDVLEKEKKYSTLNQSYVKSSTELNLYNNRAIKIFREDRSLQMMIKDRKISWQKHKDEVWHWYKEIVKKSDPYQEYIKIANPTFEEDKRVVNQIIKSIIFKNEQIEAFMEDQDLFWQEDKIIIKSMLVRTIKNMKENEELLELTVLSNNWEDDKLYFKQLFEHTIRNQNDYEKILVGKVKNWEIDRIAALDYILLQMAMNEMINFPSIPIKVTINEYIEISKLYSTPKSKHFINGILDVVATELVADGVIRKSGRGLIDNK
jgi:transcription antitermination protein NusB